MKKLLLLTLFFSLGIVFTMSSQTTRYKLEYSYSHTSSEPSQINVSLGALQVISSFTNSGFTESQTVDRIVTFANPVSTMDVNFVYDTDESIPGNFCEDLNVTENFLFTTCALHPGNIHFPIYSCANFNMSYFRLTKMMPTLEVPLNNEVNDCDPFSLGIYECRGSYALQYRLSNGSTGFFKTYGSANGGTSHTIGDISPSLSANQQFEVRARYTENAPHEYSPWQVLDIKGCPPELLDNLTTSTNQTCHSTTDGSVTLTFDRDVTLGSKMRFFLYEGTPPNPNDPEILAQNPSFPGTTQQTVADPLLLLSSGPNGFSGTASDLDGSSSIDNGNTILDYADYFIVYQEFDDSTTPVTVSSGGITPSTFRIGRPSEITIDIPPINVTQPECFGDTGEVTIIGFGGGLAPNTNATLEYGIKGDSNSWQASTTFSNLATGDYIFVARTAQDCVSADSETITITVPTPLSFDNAVSGIASSPTAEDGVINVDYDGGTPGQTPDPNYTFRLFIENTNSPPTFDEILNPDIDNDGFNGNVEFRGLVQGTYRIEIADSNGCTETTESIGDLQVTAAPTPQLEVPVPTDPFCNNGTDGSVSFVITNPVNPYQYRVLDNNNISVDSGNGIASPSASIPLTSNNLGAGNYSIEVIYDTGSFEPSIGVASRLFSITNPNPITVTLADVVSLDCNGTSDGYIEIQVSEAGDFQYAYRNLGEWFDLDATGRIPITQSGSYNDIQVRKLRNPSDIVGCVSTNELDDVLVPAGITVSEIIANHQDVSTNGGDDGVIEIDVMGGTGPFIYTWLKDGQPFVPPAGSTDTNLINLQEGVYDLTVSETGPLNCSVNLNPSITISEPSPLSIQPLTGTDTCNGLDTGTITATVQGTGDITFEFLLEPGPSETVAYTITTPDRTVIAPDLATGIYGLRITEVTGGNTITTPATDYFIINELIPITATATPTDLNCNETNTGVITVTGATGGTNTGFEYAIDDGFGFQPGNTFTGLAPRQYLITVRDNLGCEFITPVEVIQSGAPIVNELTTVVTNASSATNSDGSIILEFENTDITNFTYAWSGPGLVDPTITKDINFLGTGNYEVIVSAPGNCTLTIPFTVGVTDAFSIQSFTATPSCFGQSTGSLTATIGATGLVTFNWFDVNDPINPVATETTALRTLSTQNLATGTYYLEIIDTNGVTVRSATNEEVLELAEVSATVDAVATCLGSDTGSITFSNPIGSPSSAYSYSIDGGLTFQVSPLFENLAANTYDLRVSIDENNSCDFVVPGVTITTSPGIFWDEPNTTITRASGPGANDGAIAPAFTGGTAPLTYLWSANASNATSQNITGLPAGIYTVTVTDASDCSINQSFEVTEVGPLSISNIIAVDATCRGAANGSITTTVTGEGTITYLWTLESGDPIPVSNGVNGPNLNGILAGDYILTATDNNTTLSTAVITIGEPATTVTITNITPTDVSCFGGNDGTLEIQAAGGSGPYTYSLNGGAFQTSPIFTGLLATSYTVRVQDANACEFIEPTPILVLEPQELNLIINEQRPVTAANEINGAIFITVEGGSDTYSYEWSGPNGFASTDEDISNLAAGNYSVTITDANFAVSNGAGCRLSSAPIAITEPGQLIADLTQTVPLECSGDDFAEVTANVQGGVLPYTYQWFQISNGNNTLLDEDTDIIGNLSAGNYFVRATDSNSITIESNPINITEPTQLEIIVDNTINVICAGQLTGSINITVSGGTPPYQYFWSNSATVADISGLDAGDYTIDVEDAAGCIDQNTITITAPDDVIQVANATVDNVSAYQALDGSISLDISGGLAPYTYVWTRLSDNSNAGDQATILNLSADSYTVFISDASGCTVAETYEITQPDIVEDTIVQPSCSGEADGSITVSVNQGNGSFTYLWNTGATENNINNLASGTYTVTVTGFENGPLTRSYVLENPVPLEVNLGADRVLCADQILELDATVDDETANYSWISDTGFTSSAPNIVITQTGNYTVSVQSQTGCTAQGTIFVDISTDEINAEFAMSSQVFAGETAVAVDISYPLPEGVEWVVPIGAEVVTQNSDEAQFSFAEAGEYEIGIITTRGDCIAQKTKKIIVVAPDGAITEEDTQNGKKLISDFMVYPNPSSGKFTADVNLTERGSISIKVFSFANNAMMASKKDRGELSYSIPFDLTGLPVGVYAVLLETPYGNTLRKVILK